MQSFEASLESQDIENLNFSPTVLSHLYSVLSEFIWQQQVLNKNQHKLVNLLETISIGESREFLDINFVAPDTVSKLAELRNALLIASAPSATGAGGRHKALLPATLSASIATLFDTLLGVSDAIMAAVNRPDVDDGFDNTTSNLVATGTFFLSRSVGELDRLSLVVPSLKGIDWLGKASVLAYLVSALFTSVRLVKLTTIPNLDADAKFISASQLTLDMVGGAGVAGFTAFATHAARTGTTLGRVPLIGLFVSLLATALSPLTFYSISKEKEYVEKLEEVDKQLGSFGYPGYRQLAQIYQSKTGVDGGFEIARTVISIAGGGISTLAMAGVITFPIALAVGAISIAVLATLDATQRPALERIANKAKKTLLEYEKNNEGRNYFQNGLDATYKNLSVKLLDALKEMQRSGGGGQVAALTQIKPDVQMRELAAITKLGEKLPSPTIYAIFSPENSMRNPQQKISLDVKEGIIHLSHSVRKQTLLFTTPLMAPGGETRARVPSGKNQFTTHLNFTSPFSWQLHDGGSDSVMDFTNTVQRVQLKNSDIKNIAYKVNMGEGDDRIVVGTGEIEVDGGEGHDVADYRKLFSIKSHIEVETNADLSYNVTKVMQEASMYEEVVKNQQHKYGKRTEQIEYRDVELITLASYKAMDTLRSIECILATPGNDIFSGGSADEIFYGLGGDDCLNGKEGNDILEGGPGNDLLVGGRGNDWLNGGEGSDIYLFQKGDGQDFITDIDPNPYNQDKLIIYGGITKEEIWLSRQGYDLELSVIGTADKISFSGWYMDPRCEIERIVISSAELSSLKVNLLVEAMAAFKAPTEGDVFHYPEEVWATLSSYWVPDNKG